MDDNFTPSEGEKSNVVIHCHVGNIRSEDCIKFITLFEEQVDRSDYNMSAQTNEGSESLRAKQTEMKQKIGSQL